MYNIEEIRNELEVAISQYRSEYNGLAPVCHGYTASDVPGVIETIALLTGHSVEKVQRVFDRARDEKQAEKAGTGTLAKLTGFNCGDLAILFMYRGFELPKIFVGAPIRLAG